MAPLITLMLTSVVARIVGARGVGAVDSWPEAMAFGLAAMFTLTGVVHFVNPLRRDMIAIVPGRVPAPGLMVTITGALELLGAVGLVVPATRAAAAGGLFALLLAMFPANAHAAGMANAPASMASPLGLRTAEQALYLTVAAVVGVAALA